jgi:hypothetical protein
MSDMFNLDRTAAVKFIASTLPDADWVLKHLESKGEWLQLPPMLINMLEKSNIDNYAELYLDERSLGLSLPFAILGGEGLKEFGQRLEEASPEERVKLLNGLMIDWEGAEFPSIPKTEKEISAAKKLLEEMPEDQREAAIKQGRIFLMSFLANFYNQLSLMVHGEKITALVSQALNGNDKAFVLAVQIDRTVLVGLPYFRSRLIKAQREGHADFLDALGYRIANPVAKGKIRYRRLWLCFALLDGFGYLDGSRNHGELLKILDEAGLDSWENRIEDEGYFSKRLRDYRKFQQRARKGKP